MKRCIMIALSMILVFPVLSRAMDVTLQWNANSESNLAGYEVHYDTDSGDPYNGKPGTLQDGTPAPSPIIMSFDQDENPDPDVVEFTVHNLPTGFNYFFAVKAFNDLGLRSDFSNEVNTDDEFPAAPGIIIKKIITTQTQRITIENRHRVSMGEINQ